MKYHVGLSTENNSRITLRHAKTIPKRASHFHVQKLATTYIARRPETIKS